MTEEYDRYRREKARAWLEHVRRLGAEADRLQALVESERAMLDGVRGIDYTVEHVSGTRDAPDLADLVDALFDHIRDYTASLAAYSDERSRAARALESLPDARERAVLTRRYLIGEGWGETAAALGYSVPYAKAFAAAGTLHAYDIMPTEWRDPSPPAL